MADDSVASGMEQRQQAEARRDRDEAIGTRDEKRLSDVVTSVQVLGEGAAFKVDRAFFLDGVVVLSGWRTASVKIEIDEVRAFLNYRREDAERLFGKGATGFLAVADIAPKASKKEIALSTSSGRYYASIVPARDDQTLRHIVQEHPARLHRLVPALVSSRMWGTVLRRLSVEESSTEARGYLDDVRCVEGAGLCATGWVLSSDIENVWIVTEEGYWAPLSVAESLPRPDVLDAFRAEYRNWPYDPGFYACITGDLKAEAEVSLVHVTGKGFFRLHTVKSTRADPDPVEFARFAFSISTPLQQFAARAIRHDGPLIERLLTQWNEAFSRVVPQQWQFGQRPVAPEASVIVPLYGRWDFVEHQLLEFARDADFVEKVELIYVIDDPSIVSPFLANAHQLNELYGVPFTVLWGKRNRGFSGANNLGAGEARGRFLTFLNSDVFPDRPGWISELTRLLDENPEYGIVAPRLLYPDGGLQHAGMDFEYDEFFQVWLNVHPLSGLDPSYDHAEGLEERPAVTGACMVLRREDFETVGGFDTGYLIGDFEDSDLCLKLRQQGVRIGYFSGVQLTHLERQSFRSLGGDDFRQKVVLWNAARHSCRWGSLIARNAKEQSHG